jgi:uncharacterized coiled-coil DUF342 family protein
LTQETKPSELATISQQIDAVREQLNKTNTDIIQHVEKRDKLNQQAQTFRQEITELKKERDALNESVKTLKQQRDEMRIKIRPYIEEIKAHSEKIRELKEKRSGQNRHELQKQLDAIEWKIATTSLDLHEEKRLIDQVKQLEIQLIAYKKMDQHSKKISEIKAELKVYQDQADAFHKELTENAKKSQELHAKMQLKFAEMAKIRDDATNLHVQYLLAKEQIKPLHDQIVRLMEQRRMLQETARGEFEKSKKNKEQEIKEKLGSQARDKLQRGEKLNWQEFQLMAGSDKSETED